MEITWKDELKFKETNQCVLFVAGANKANAINSNIIFIIEDTKLYVLAVSLSAKDNQKLSKLLSKGFEKSVYWNNKTKIKNKDSSNEYKFLEWSFVGVKRLFILTYSNQDDNTKTYKTKMHYLL